ncbi:MAG: esterase/lipase family protein [Candidatus Neomarinimicrobiota bacterium]
MRLFTATTIFFSLFVMAENNYPIVLIHGFMGWGPEEMGNYSYWGGKSNYIKDLADEEHKIMAVSVGPISSNWDRAIEAFYQIKGGQVDYGSSHSEKNNIIRMPKEKNYVGLYPQWSKENPVHIIGHSMGGQTARMLNYLLTQEINHNNGEKEESVLLGKSHLGWIKSITTISTPHDGTTLSHIITSTIPYVQYFAGIAGLFGNNYFHFDLEQFGIKKQKNETWLSFITGLKDNSVINTKNFSAYDLSLPGAKAFNAYSQASPDVYYFSFITSTTKKDEKTSFHVPFENTPLLNKARAKLIGSRSGYWADGNQTDSLWFENDGVVNSISMFGPTTGANGSDPIIEYDPKDLLITGQWYWTKVNRMDHWSVIGHFGSEEKKLRGFKIIKRHIKLLKNLQ